MRSPRATPIPVPTSALGVALLTIALVAGACSDSDAAPSAGDTTPSSATPTTASSGMSTTTVAAPDAESAAVGSGAVDGETVQAAIDSLAEAYRRSVGLWSGFDPGDHPTIIPFRTDGEIGSAIAVNHPKPADLGDATALDTAGTPFASLHRIDSLNDPARERLDRIDAFDFHVEIGDTDAFVLMADTGDSFLDPADADWGATFIHELFHRYQDDAFAGSLGAQDVEGYAYTEDNLELAVLEERALAAAVTAEGDEALTVAARHFAGLRLARVAADDRVELDASQEMFEGTARYVEHRLSGTDQRYSYHDENYDRDLAVSLDGERIKDTFGFGRFYSSGAAVLRVLDRLEVADSQQRVEAGDDPASILIDHLDVVDGDADRLVAEARAAYDPDGDLPATAAEAAAIAAEEGPVFGDEEGDGAGADGPGAGADGAIEVTDEQIACLDDAGIEDGEAIPDDVWEQCVGT